MKIDEKIASELSVSLNQVASAITLIDEGATIPFIARYRKEVTGGLDDIQLRTLEERLIYLRELDDRRQAIIKSIEKQGKMTEEIRAKLLAADTKVRLEDLYLPYKPKRRTKATIAKEAGLEPLAEILLSINDVIPTEAAKSFINLKKKIIDTKGALEGARYIIMERIAEEPELVGKLRDYLWKNGIINSTVIEGQEENGNKFRDYFDYSEPIKSLPSHRILAILRGRKEKILRLKIAINSVGSELTGNNLNHCEKQILNHFSLNNRIEEHDKWLRKTVQKAWRIRLQPRLEIELFLILRENAEEEAIKVFAANLKDLLMAPGAGHQAIIGLDPGIRTGVKVAVIDDTGKLLETSTIYPHPPFNKWEQSILELNRLATQHNVSLISIGNGTASRETDKLVKEWFSHFPDNKIFRVIVSEAGASVYSASKLAADEFPELDVSLRGAVSIARRLQDPLAELVKIDPKSIGVGQYQHDVNQLQLNRALTAVVEDCVNAVGVDINTASASLLTYVSGLNETIAKNIVDFRNENGPFNNRKKIIDIPRFGKKTFEQAAGFLRILGGENPLDASAVHPEAYPVVYRILKHTKQTIEKIIGDANFLKKLNPANYIDDFFGIPTVKDIINELEKPGRDPRKTFKIVSYQEGVNTIGDLKEEMILEGVISNVTNFGAFVDIGVHQDGLIHISQLADHFVKNPREIVKTGDIVSVKVISVDVPRKRIALTMKKSNTPKQAKTAKQNFKAKPKNKTFPKNKTSGKNQHYHQTIFGKAFENSINKKKKSNLK